MKESLGKIAGTNVGVTEGPDGLVLTGTRHQLLWLSVLLDVAGHAGDKDPVPDEGAHVVLVERSPEEKDQLRERAEAFTKATSGDNYSNYGDADEATRLAFQDVLGAMRQDLPDGFSLSFPDDMGYVVVRKNQEDDTTTYWQTSSLCDVSQVKFGSIEEALGLR